MSLTRCWLLLLPLLACSTGSLGSRCARVTCVEGSSCEPSTGKCVATVVDGGIGCKSDLSCAAPAGHCLVAERRCVGCVVDTHCSAGSCDPTQHQCVQLPDSCSSAQTINLSTGSAHLVADTTRANDDTRLPCALPGTRSNDLVWQVTVPERRRLVATATPLAGSSLRPALALRTVCNSIDTSLNLGCSYPPLSSAVGELQLDVVDPGTYFLWVEGEDGSAGAFTLDLKLEVPPPSDSCSLPRVIEIADNSSIEILGDTRGQMDDASGTCGGSAAPDAVYAVKLSAAHRLRIDLEGRTKLFDPVLYIRSNCEDPSAQSQIACVKASSQIAAFDIPRVEPGTLFLFVDGPSTGQAGAYRLRITPYDPVPPPTNDTCTAAKALTMPANWIGTIKEQGDTSAAIDDSRGCNASGPDLVYQFTLPVARQMLARVTPLAGSSLKPVVYLRPSGKCASEALADQLSCQTAPTAGAAATTIAPNLPPGVWSLWVDGALGTSGPFDLQVEFAAPPPPPANDVCASAIPLSLNMGAVNAQGTTLGANADTATCSYPAGSPSPDVVYQVTLATRQSLSIDLKSTAGSSLNPVATLRAPNACASEVKEDQVACDWGADPQFSERAVYTVPRLDPGTYFLWVSGDEGSQGAFSLRLSSGPPIDAPLNETCISPNLPELTQNVPVAGDTRGAVNDDNAFGCGLALLDDGFGAADVAYHFTQTQQGTVTLAVTPDPIDGQLFRPVIYVRGASPTTCTFGSPTRGCTVAASYGGTATLVLNNLPPGSYAVWVDGAGLSSGKFTIKMQ